MLNVITKLYRAGIKRLVRSDIAAVNHRIDDLRRQADELESSVLPRLYSRLGSIERIDAFGKFAPYQPECARLREVRR